MAIKKSITLSSGVVCEYHKISDIDTKSKDIKVAIYLNKEARDAGKDLCEAKVYSYGATLGNAGVDLFTEEVLKQEGKTHKVLAYTYLKTLPAFEGAEDI